MNLPASVIPVLLFALLLVPPSSQAQGSTPFNGTPQAIPGTIEIERFDEGGQGTGYYDTTAGSHGQDYDQAGYPVPSFRQPTDVDLYKSAGYSGGYLIVGQAGDWLNYTADISTAGTYTLSARVAWGNAVGGTFRVEVDGVDATGPIQIPDTGWSLQTITKAGVWLPSGRHVLRVVWETNASNGYTGDIDYLNFTLEAASGSAPTAGLAGYWKFDEGSGTTAADSSGNNLAGSLQGPSWAAGQSGGSLSFDGADDYVGMGSPAGLVAGSSFSVSAWLYPTGAGSLPTYGGIVVNKEGEYELARFSDGTIQWAVASASPGWAWVNTGAAAPLNQWTHVTFVYDGAAGKTYVNGALAHTQAVTGAVGDVEPSQNEFRVGGRQCCSQNFAGRLDEVRVYSRALSAGEAAQVFGAAGGSVTPSAKGNYSLSLNGAGQYVEVPSSESLNITGPLTVEAWVKPSSSGRLRGVVERYNWVSSADGGYALRLSAENKVQFYIIQSNTVVAYVSGNTAVTAGTWHHIAAVFDGTRMQVYVDGRLDGSVESSLVPAPGTASLKIGYVGYKSDSDANNYFFDGLIDEARVTSGVVYRGDFTPQLPLTASAVVEAIDGAGTRGYWDFENRTANDSSGHENHGALIGSTAFVAEASDYKPLAIIQNPYTIDFNNLAAGTLVTNQYHPRATFSSLGFSAGAVNTTQQYYYPSPWVWNTYSGYRSLYSSQNPYVTNNDLFVDFPEPANNLSFRILNVVRGTLNYPSWTLCYIDVYQNGLLYRTYSLTTSGSGNPITVDLRSIPNITGIHIRNVMNGYYCCLSTFPGLHQQHMVYYDDFNFTYPLNCPSGTSGCPTPTPTPTPIREIKQVMFEQVNSPIDANPNLGGGLRVFPDSSSPTAPANKALVRVKADTSYPVNTTIYFRSFDLDDPSNDPVIDPNGGNGDDNRVEAVNRPGRLSAPSAQTDSSGRAVVEFEVTKQPGDNFAVVASTDKEFLKGIGVRENGLFAGNGSPVLSKLTTAMLTVWRRVHVEVDSMGRVSGNKVTGSVLSARPETSKMEDCQSGRKPHASCYDYNYHAIEVEPSVDITRFDSLTSRMIIDGTSYRVISYEHSKTDGRKFITIETPTKITPRAGAPYTLYDDDDFNNDDGLNVDGDDNPSGGEDVEATASYFSLMQESDKPSENIFAAAYIKPSYGWAKAKNYNNGSVPFALNVDLGSNQAIQTQCDLGWNSKNDEHDDFWVIYVQVGYQPSEVEDYDPNGGEATGGVALSFSGDEVTFSNGVPVVPVGGDVSLIFIETIRDSVRQSLKEPHRYAPHEVGHQFGVKGDTRTGFGVMSFGMDEPVVFVPQHINVLRYRKKSPGRS